MKKFFFTTLMLTALLAATFGTAFAGSALELLGVSHNSGGISFTFRVNGEFSADELASGFVQVQGGDDFPLYCSQTAPDEVVCHTSKKVAGKDVVVGFGGARFWTDVPAEWVGIPTCGEGVGYWWPVYGSNNLSPAIPTDWQQWDWACTDTENPVERYGYYIPGDPNKWGIYYEFDAGSNPFPGDLGLLFGLPYIDPGFYQ
jgi:hypothetical protein